MLSAARRDGCQSGDSGGAAVGINRRPPSLQSPTPHAAPTRAAALDFAGDGGVAMEENEIRMAGSLDPGTAKAPAPAESLRATALRLIQGWRWFAHVPPEAHEWLAERASLRDYPKGRILYTTGEPASTVYAVVSGICRIYRTSPKGDELTMEEVVRGGWFPHILPIPSPTYLVSCACQQDATLLTLPQSLLTEFGRRWPGYYQGLYHELGARAGVIFGRIELLSLHNLNVRLAVYLLRMARLRGEPQDDGAIWVAAEESQSEVGSRVGGTRQRVNSVLKAWGAKGMIELHKDGVRILDVRRLRAEAEKSGFDLADYLGGWHGGWQGKP